MCAASSGFALHTVHARDSELSFLHGTAHEHRKIHTARGRDSSFKRHKIDRMTAEMPNRNSRLDQVAQQGRIQGGGRGHAPPNADRICLYCLKCTKFDFGWGSAQTPLGELTALPQTP